MTGWLLPRRLDDGYEGRTAALWILGLILLVELGIGVRSVFDAHAVASAADGIPLDNYVPAAARTIVALFALLGMSRLVLALLGTVVLLRYRGLVPPLYALLLFDAIGRRLILRFRPIPRSGGAGGSAVTWALLLLMVAGLSLSVWRRRRVAGVAAPGPR